MKITSIIKTYYRLTKPGIIYANVLSATAGYLFASKWHIDFSVLLSTVIGTSLVIAGACVYNNCMDREIDKKMARTRKRALVTGEVNLRRALVYATVLTMFGFVILALWVNLLVVLIGLIGFVDYLALYGLAKRHSVYSTIVGSVSGSASVVAGYCAAVNRFDGGAFILFLILTFWQMPHFYSISLFRRKDYAAAGLPVLSTKRDAAVVKRRIMLYIIGFYVVASLLAAKHYAGNTYLIIVTLLALGWLWTGVKYYGDSDDARWGKKMFLFSLVVILGLSLAISVGSVLV